MDGKHLRCADRAGGRWRSYSILLSVALLLVACGTTDSVVPRHANRADLENGVLFVGSMVKPENGAAGRFAIWLEGADVPLMIGEEQTVVVKKDGVDMSLFAIAMPPGRYVLSAASALASSRRQTGRGIALSANSGWVGSQLFGNLPTQAGDFVYMGRLTCDGKWGGCTWYVVDKREEDLRLLKSANPRLPWEDVKFRMDYIEIKEQ